MFDIIPRVGGLAQGRRRVGRFDLKLIPPSEKRKKNRGCAFVFALKQFVYDWKQFLAPVSLFSIDRVYKQLIKLECSKIIDGFRFGNE